MDAEELDDWLAGIKADWRTVELSALDAGICAYAEKLTSKPAEMTAGDLERLRKLGLDDEGLHVVIQVTSYFNYINRIADAMHVDLEDSMPPYPRA